MHHSSGDIIFSPSDLITFMESAYASAMERHRLLDASIAEFMDSEDVVLASLQQKGYEHDGRFTQSLKNAGHVVLETKRSAPTNVRLTTPRRNAEFPVDVSDHIKGNRKWLIT